LTNLLQVMNSNINSAVFSQYFFNGLTAPSGPGPPHYRGFKITLRYTTLGTTLLEECSAHHRDLYLTTHNTHKRQTYVPPIGIEITDPKNERPQTHALDRADVGINICLITVINQTVHCNCVMQFNIPVILSTLNQIESSSLVA
jgi:hypothetical protein